MNISSQVKVARTTTEMLRGDLARLSRTEWETPRACGDWTVAEVVAHLAGGAERYASYIRRGLEGIAEPPEGSTFYANRTAGSQVIRQRTHDQRRQMGDEVLSRFALRSMELVELFESLGRDDWERPTFHPMGVLPIAGLLGWRICELSLHRWDIFNAIGHEAHLPEHSLEPIIGWLPRWFRVGFQPSEPLGRQRRYQFALSSPLQTVVSLTIFGDRFEIRRDDGGSADAVLTTDPETFILTAMGRLTWLQAVESGRIRVSGDQCATVELSRWFGPL